ncbi:thioredoxin [Williamwhitmania taraxaci]|uniref:Thioredoxin n=1 Tax=Williamwhitmania taraxaci TaxID=1640674 RepID=A0A1G6GU68_9BACT|nr:thioredoxin [Williamwhitmania taraxaci]SDB85514.1 thioredoxin [Williamwhitmania taraxaci]
MSIGAIIAIVLAVVVVGYFGIALRRMKKIQVPSSEKIVNLNEANFEHQIKRGITLVDFWATWCMPCKIMVPALNDVAEELDGKVKIAKVDVDQNQSLSAKFKVRSIPTLILFKDGKEINRFVGVKDRNFLLKQLKAVL